MKPCSIYGCKFPAVVGFGTIKLPTPNGRNLYLEKDDRIIIDGIVCTVVTHIGGTLRVEYGECMFHYGVWRFLYALVEDLVKLVKKWI